MGGGIARGFERLAAAEARLAPSTLLPADAEALARLRSDIAAGLVLLLSREEASMSCSEVAAAAVPLELTLPAHVMVRLPAVARLAALDLAAVADGVAAQLAVIPEGDAGAAQKQKPRRRQGRPRLELVIP